jgi:Protein of unknown function (DUF3616)
MQNLCLTNQILLTFSESFKEHRKDISAIRLTLDQHLWLGSDETSTIERLSFVDTNHFAEHKQFHVSDFVSLPAPDDEEIDIEGLGYDNYYLWFIGSHSYKRKKPKPEHSDEKNIKRLTKIKSEPNRYILGRIPLVNGELLKSCPHPENDTIQLSAAKLEVTQHGNLLMEALANDPHLGFFVQAAIPGKDNGFDIEGIAVYQSRIFLGLRGPVLRGWAVMLEIELEDSGTELMTLKTIDADGMKYKKHFVFLNGLGIRDLFVNDEDFLILAGPTMDLDGPVRVYCFKNGVNLQPNVLHYPEHLLDLPHGNGDDHAEGVTLFQDITGFRSLLAVYDSPAYQRLVGDAGVIADVFKLE